MEALCKETLIAPCGMNCGLCMAFLRTKNQCCGCIGPDEGKSPSCVRCIIKNCAKLDSKFCFDCNEFPCKRLKQLDKRYRTKYHMSMIENLAFIKKAGMHMFLESEKTKWTCPECGGTICVHRSNCSNCGKIFSELPLI